MVEDETRSQEEIVNPLERYLIEKAAAENG